jgi:hypothetical protein
MFHLDDHSIHARYMLRKMGEGGGDRCYAREISKQLTGSAYTAKGVSALSLSSS